MSEAAEKQWAAMKELGIDVGAFYKLAIKKFLGDIRDNLSDLEQEIPDLRAWFIAELQSVISFLEPKEKKDE